MFTLQRRSILSTRIYVYACELRLAKRVYFVSLNTSAKKWLVRDGARHRVSGRSHVRFSVPREKRDAPSTLII